MSRKAEPVKLVLHECFASHQLSDVQETKNGVADEIIVILCIYFSTKFYFCFVNNQRRIA